MALGFVMKVSYGFKETIFNFTNKWLYIQYQNGTIFGMYVLIHLFVA